MLADNPYAVYAISKSAAKLLESTMPKPIPDTETPAMVIQVMQYDLDYSDVHAIDPLTAVLSISEEDKADPRVDGAITEILEDCLHDKRA
jgi:hypothetical protein